MKYCYHHEHLHHYYHFKQSLRLFSLHLPIVTFNYSCDFQLFLYYAREYSIIPRIILTKIATYYSQNYAGILGSGLPTTGLYNAELIIQMRIVN